LTPFFRARQAAFDLRKKLFSKKWAEAISSYELLDAAESEDGEDLLIDSVSPKDLSLGGADALLQRDLRQILVRNDVPLEERAFLIAHEIGHWKLHPKEHDGCHKVVEGTLDPENADSFGTQKVEAYGARERAELQANTFAKEFLLPRETAKTLFHEGKTASAIAKTLILPLELVRQQLFDALLLPEPPQFEDEPAETVKPTAEQMKAAFSKERVSLVVAGPGTGKTTTLLLRIQHQLKQGVKPSEMLVLTFSNRAARELVERFQLLDIEDVHDIWVGTFHTFGLEFLRKNYQHFGLKAGFGVADKLAQISILEDHIHDVELKAFNPLGDPLDWLNEVVTVIQRAKDELAGPADYLAAVEKTAKTTDTDVLSKRRDIAVLYAKYESEKSNNGRLADLGDLVMLPTLALRKDPSKFNGSVGRFKHILVDEYQDVNRASAELIRALNVKAESLWVVGDPRQAIYRFRGASMRNIVHFGQDFPEYREFTLSENRRSFEEIVRVFEHTGTKSHPLQTVLPLDNVQAVRGTGGVRPMHLVCGGEDVAQHELVERVKSLEKGGIPFRNQVILASTHRICGTAAEALIQAGVPALHLGDIFQRSEIKNLLSLMQILVDRSGSALIRLAQLPELALPDADVQVLLSWLRINRPEPLSWLTTPPIGLSSIALESLARWATIFKGFRSIDSPWDVMCELLLERTELLVPFLQGADIVAVTRRLALWQFIYFLRVPDGAQPYQTVGSFITRLRRRLRIADDRELRVPPPEADNLNAVAVMTIHQSKGLEFEAVHLVDVDASHFRAGTDSSLVPEALLESISEGRDFEGRTESSNKLYVALSRAKKHLILYENTQSRWNAECEPAVAAAAHLFDRQNGAAPQKSQGAIKNSVIPEEVNITKASATDQPRVVVEVEKFISYTACPRKYYYEQELGLTPSSGLPYSILVEMAVMEELFAPNGTSATELLTSPGALARLFVSIANTDSLAIPYLRAYADGLLANGRHWLGADRTTLPGTIDVLCANLPIRLTPHQIIKNGSTYTVRFFRSRPFGKGTRQEKVLRWALKQLADTNPDKSIISEVCILSTGRINTIKPYRTPPGILLQKASNFQNRNFNPQEEAWDCARCRHFVYCPA
jgi:superfamily I DNA/RNA helicase